ncbi:hypothetical protein CY652_16905 [Burkholderia sp. WAC0059]|uniref:hypothetical protein n=1 Tax=Burkholderia sp. WAC0059 TaxID=2066022 RepID=UPI000C7EF26A|nr:hypothetical protein [Burkholderia sp. WAC0059]PLZ01226.1 hypothetical protein CY652_16905 [Burkholderia sp. WAC0059]
MTIHGTFGLSHVTIAFLVLAALLVGGLLAAMHVRGRYSPSLIGALIGAMFCFLLLEALPALV